MNRRIPACATGAALMVIAFSAPPMRAGSQATRPSQSHVVLTHELPRLDGAKLATTLVEVTYAPGGANPAHRHPCPVVGYVLDGHLRMQIDGQPARVYGPGETFFESPADVHRVSANVSDEHPARFLAFFICDHQTPLSIPLSGRGQQ